MGPQGAAQGTRSFQGCPEDLGVFVPLQRVPGVPAALGEVWLQAQPPVCVQQAQGPRPRRAVSLERSLSLLPPLQTRFQKLPAPSWQWEARSPWEPSQSVQSRNGSPQSRWLHHNKPGQPSCPWPCKPPCGTGTASCSSQKCLPWPQGNTQTPKAAPQGLGWSRELWLLRRKGASRLQEMDIC